MSQDLASFGDLDVQQSDQGEEAEFGALEVQQAQVLFSALKAIQNGTPSLNWISEAAAEIEVYSLLIAGLVACPAAVHGLWWAPVCSSQVSPFSCFRVSRSALLKLQLQQKIT